MYARTPSFHRGLLPCESATFFNFGLWTPLRAARIMPAMGVFLDEVAIELEGASIGEVVTAAQKRIRPAGRVMMKVVVNVEPLAGDALADRQGETVGDQQGGLYSAEPRSLSTIALQQIGGRLEEVRSAQAEIAELLQQERPSDAFNHLGETLEVWVMAQQAVLHSAQLTGIDLNKLTVQQRVATDLIADLRQKFEQFKIILSSGDAVGLTDAMAHEWPQMFDAWQQIIEQVSRSIDQLPSDSQGRAS